MYLDWLRWEGIRLSFCIVRVLSIVYRGGVLYIIRGLFRVKIWVGDGLCLLCFIILNLVYF